jgi:sterol desaturase/sphingolipid hydroxylase (fatty acid hydroxylase superfamily)
MFTHWEDFETLAFVVLAIMFEVLERTLPARTISKKRDIRLDVLAVVVLSVTVASARGAYGAVIAAIPESASELLTWARSLSSAPKIALAFLFTDFALYWIHRAMHTFDPFWRTHVWHHTTTNLYWLSGARTSVVHGAIYTIPQVVFPFYVFKFSLFEAAIAFPIGVLVQFWEHSNLALNLGPINWLFVNPVFHRVHHSIERKHHDSNYGTLLTIWDRMFGTYNDPAQLPSNHPLGVEQAPKTLRMVLGV